MDIIIKNGIVIDPSQNIHQKMDLHIKDGVFVPPMPEEMASCEKIIDAEGCYVTPGLIDAHIHVYHDASETGGKADLICLPNCVTTAIDAGSSGIYNFDGFYKNVIVQSTTTIKAMLQPTKYGVQVPPYEEVQDPVFCDTDKIRRLYKKYPDALVGLKLRMHADVTREFEIEALKKAEQTAKQLRQEGMRCNLTVHFGAPGPGVTLEEILSLLGQGDVFTHTFRGDAAILDENNKVLASVRDARARGVLFDTGCSRINYTHVRIKAALADGFAPQIISSDLVKWNFYKSPVFTLLFRMSLFLNMGMALEDIIRAVTYTPAATYQILDQAGTLQYGAKADVAIFSIFEKPTRFTDINNDVFMGNHVLMPMATIKEGAVVYQQMCMA